MRQDILANSASRGSFRKENSVSSNALKTSAGEMVFLPAATVFSLALWCVTEVSVCSNFACIYMA